MIRAGIYARISSDRDGDQLGVRRQVADCEAYAARRDWEIVDRYIDDDISAYSGKARPEYERLLADIQAGSVEAVVVWHVDRLHRQPKELEHFIEVCDAAGIGDLASVTGDIDLATHDGRFTARILGAVARKESDDKSRRIRRKMAELALAGKGAGGGTRPFGYDDDRLTIREGEAVVIRECAERLLAGESLRSISTDLIEREVPTVTGAEWKTQTLRRLLRSGRISGQREHRGQIVAEAEWPAIIDRSATARIRALLDDPSRRTNRTARRYLLARLLRCELCGATLVSRPRDNGTRRYICARGVNFDGCGRLYIVADELEAHVVEAVLYRLDSPELGATITGSVEDPDADRWQAEANDAATQLDELARLWADRAISMPEWIAARQPIEDRMRSAKRRLARMNQTAALDGHVGNASELRPRWTSLPLTRQRAIVAAVVDHLVVGPGRPGYNRFDLTRIKPAWRV